MRIEEQHRFRIKSSGFPTVEIDTQARAVYVRFKRATVAKTVAQPSSGMHIAIDLDRNGEVIGIEVVGVDEFGLQSIARKAHVDVPQQLADRARYIPANLAMAGEG